MRRTMGWILAVLLILGMMPVQQILAAPTGSTVIYAIPATMNGTYSNDFGVSANNFTTGSSLPDSLLALHLRMYVDRADQPGSIDKFIGGDGQIELSSSGTCDKQEINWLVSSLNLKSGWNDIMLPFSTASRTDGSGSGSGAFDKTKIKWFRFYNIAADAAKQFNVKVDTVELLDMTNVLQLSPLYADNMLFQHDKPIKMSGTAGPGHSITAKMLDAGGAVVGQATATVANDRSWALSLPKLPGGYTKYSIQILDDGVLTTTLSNIVVGELWLASGQSNMEFLLKHDPDGHNVLLNGSRDEYLRYYVTPHVNGDAQMPYDPQSSISGVWGTAADTTHLGDVYAIAYHFAAKLRSELDMPVGIMDAAYGGSPIYAWISRSAIDANSTVKAYLQNTSRYVTADNWNQAGGNNYRQMSALFNQYIAPLTAMSIAGTIWYQGEDQANEPSGTYSTALELLQQDYSARFGFANESMPLIYCHITSELYNSSSAELDQLGYFAEDLSNFWQNHPNTTAQCTTYDLPYDYDYTAFLPGESGIAACHTMYKKPVGERMAQAALGLVYSKSTEYTSPVFKSVSVDSADHQKLLIQLDHVGDGLAAESKTYTQYTVNPADTELRGFAVCGADGVYVPAKAQIVNGNTVKVWSDTVKYPVAATYGFTQITTNNNLVSTLNGKVLLAAVPFRTEVQNGSKYYRTHDWTYCDIPQIWHYTSYDTAVAADGWVSGLDPRDGGSVTISYDPSTKTAGNASVKVEYTTDQYKAARIGIGLLNTNGSTFPDTDYNYSQFQTLSFDFKNVTGRHINLGELKLFTADGTMYRPYLLENDWIGFDLPVGNSDWRHLTYNLTKMIKGNDWNTYYDNSVLQDVRTIVFTVYDDDGVPSGQSGTVYFDNLMFGFKPDKAEVNKQELLAALQAGRGVDTSLYTAATVATFNSKMTAAKTALDNFSTVQNTADTAAQELTAAVNALVLIPADKTALNAAIAAATGKTLSDYTSATAALVQQKLATAQGVVADADATQAQVDSAAQQLNAALDALVAKGDKTVLNAAIAAAAGKTLSDYTSATAALVQQKLAAAQGVAADADATQAQVNTAAQQLNAAMDALVAKGGKTTLNAAIAAATGKTLSNYTSATAALVQQKLAAAQGVAADADATQAQIDTAVQQLNAALDALALKPGEQTGDKSPDTSDNGLPLFPLFTLLLAFTLITFAVWGKNRFWQHG